MYLTFVCPECGYPETVIAAEALFKVPGWINYMKCFCGTLTEIKQEFAIAAPT